MTEKRTQVNCWPFALAYSIIPFACFAMFFAFFCVYPINGNAIAKRETKNKQTFEQIKWLRSRCCWRNPNFQVKKSFEFVTKQNRCQKFNAHTYWPPHWSAQIWFLIIFFLLYSAVEHHRIRLINSNCTAHMKKKARKTNADIVIVLCKQMGN